MKQGKDGWLELDVAQDMGENARLAYMAYKEAYKHAQDMRKEYEQALDAQLRASDDLGDEHALVFGYNFGKASIKVVAAGEVKAKAATQPKKSLAEFLRESAASGRRS